MNRSRLTGRVFALAATTVVATAAAALVGAAPASAHHSIVNGTCAAGADGSWTVTWTVNNSETNKPAKIKTIAVTPAGTTVNGITVGSDLPAHGTQVVPATHQWAKLTVSSEWTDSNGKVMGEYNGEPKTGTVKLSADTCAKAPAPEPTPSVSTSPEPSTSASPEPSDSASPGPTPSDEPTLPPLPGEPDVNIVFTCDEVQMTIANPKDGEEFELVFTPSTGDKTVVKFPVGETKTLKWPAAKDFVLTVSAKDWDETIQIPWEEPEGCDSGSGGGLPVTGTAVGGIAAGAAVLLAVGVGLFVMARRRRIRFTA